MRAWYNDQPASLVLGQPDMNHSPPIAPEVLGQATAVTVDPLSGKPFVSDTLNNSRVLRFDSAASKPSGAAADAENNRVLFDPARILTPRMYVPSIRHNT